jgi:phosphoglycerate dehydrogenase-like enzyme
MLRVGYPESIPEELLRNSFDGVELVCIPERLDREIQIDVWIPDPYTSRALRAWPWLRGVRLILAMLAGTEWIPQLVGPHVTICNARGAHNTSTAEWTVGAILSMLKYFPLYNEIQREGRWKRRFELPPHYVAISGDTRPLYPPVMLEELTGKRVLLVGHG